MAATTTIFVSRFSAVSAKHVHGIHFIIHFEIVAASVDRADLCTAFLIRIIGHEPHR